MANIWEAVGLHMCRLFVRHFRCRLMALYLNHKKAFDNRYKIAFNLNNCQAIFYDFYWSMSLSGSGSIYYFDVAINYVRPKGLINVYSIH